MVPFDGVPDFRYMLYTAGVMIDTLKLSKRLREAQMPQDQAEALAEGINESLKESYVTREYLRNCLLKFELRIVGYLVLVILANHFWK